MYTTGKSLFDLTDEATLLLEQYSFPGNIRELENIIERIVILNESNYVNEEQIECMLEGEIFVTPQVSNETAFPQSRIYSRPYTKVSFNERDIILRSLKSSRGN